MDLYKALWILCRAKDIWYSELVNVEQNLRMYWKQHLFIWHIISLLPSDFLLCQYEESPKLDPTILILKLKATSSHQHHLPLHPQLLRAFLLQGWYLLSYSNKDVGSLKFLWLSTCDIIILLYVCFLLDFRVLTSQEDVMDCCFPLFVPSLVKCRKKNIQGQSLGALGKK